MEDSWKQRWDERFSKEEFAYGEEPNQYLKVQLDKLTPGSILYAAEGEGRNAVYAARLGWKVSAFDISTEGRKKALKLAEANKVPIDYRLGELQSLSYIPGQFDVVALIYAHFPADIRPGYHQALDQYLKKGGLIIFEAFSKNHIEYISRDQNVGGPKDVAMLFSVDEIRSDFPHYDIIELEEKEIELHEGLFHNGTGSVIRFTGRKK